jgi:predicted GIY-YIG superfamily endonuclease
MNDHTSNAQEYHVYLIQSLSGPVKIGIASSPVKRVKELQVGNFEDIRLEFSFVCPNMEAAIAVEALLHERYSSFRVRGEWYSVDIETIVKDVRWALHIAASIDGLNRFEHVVTLKTNPVKHAMFNRRGIRKGRSTARNAVRKYIEENPDALTLSVRELASIVGAGKTVTAEVMSEYRAQGLSNTNGHGHRSSADDGN